MDLTREFTKEGFDAYAHRELGQLEKDFRKMISKREACKKHVTKVLANQRKILNLFEEEKEHIESLIALKQSNALRKREITQEKEIVDLIRNYEKLKYTESLTQSRLSRVNEEIKSLNQEIEQINEENSRFKLETNSTDFEQLENLREVECTRYGQVLQENRSLQKIVSELLQERQWYNDSYEKLIKRLSKGKKVLFEIIQPASAAQEHGQQIHFQKSRLNTEAQKGFQLRVGEYITLRQEFDYQDVTNAFLEKKAKNREVRQTVVSEKDTKEFAMKEALTEKLRFYESILNDINKINEPALLENCIKSVAKIDDENYSIYSFLSDQNTKLTTIMMEVQDSEKELVALQAQNIERKQKKEQEFNKACHLESRLKGQLMNMKKDLRQLSKEFKEILEGVEQLFQNAQCDWKPILSMLRQSEEVTPYNINCFLIALDRRLTEVSSTVRYRQDKRKGTRAYSTPQSINISMGSTAKKKKPTIQTICPFCAETLASTDLQSAERPIPKEGLHFQVMESRINWNPALHNMADCPLPRIQSLIHRKQLLTHKTEESRTWSMRMKKLVNLYRRIKRLAVPDVEKKSYTT